MGQQTAEGTAYGAGVAASPVSIAALIVVGISL